MRTEYYRLRAVEIHNKLLQIKQFGIKHNLTIGMFAEDLLRDLLKKLLPQKVGVAQGFIVGDKQCSHQCDVIIYDRLNFAPIFKTGSLMVLPSCAVIAVIEIKTSIREKQFNKTLSDFSHLHKMGIKNKYLFVYDSCSVKTLRNYFFSEAKKENICRDMDIVIGLGKYDHDNYEELPDAIIGLKPNNEYLLKKDYVIDNRDMKGYASLILNDEKNKPVSCLEEFIIMLLSDIGDVPLVPEYGCSFNKYEGISLFDA